MAVAEQSVLQQTLWCLLLNLPFKLILILDLFYFTVYIYFQTGRIYCVREDHSGVEKGEAKEAVNTVVTINPVDSSQNILVYIFLA